MPAKTLGKHQKSLLQFVRNEGPKPRTDCYAFLLSTGVGKTHVKDVVDRLLLSGLVRDIAPNGITAIL
jgi:hypothetical protein